MSIPPEKLSKQLRALKSNDVNNQNRNQEQMDRLWFSCAVVDVSEDMPWLSPQNLSLICLLAVAVLASPGSSHHTLVFPYYVQSSQQILLV